MINVVFFFLQLELGEEEDNIITGKILNEREPNVNDVTNQVSSLRLKDDTSVINSTQKVLLIISSTDKQEAHQ